MVGSIPAADSLANRDLVTSLRAMQLVRLYGLVGNQVGLN